MCSRVSFARGHSPPLDFEIENASARRSLVEAASGTGRSALRSATAAPATGPTRLPPSSLAAGRPARTRMASWRPRWIQFEHLSSTSTAFPCVFTAAPCSNRPAGPTRATARAASGCGPTSSARSSSPPALRSPRTGPRATNANQHYFQRHVQRHFQRHFQRHLHPLLRYCPCSDPEASTTLRQTITISGDSLGVISDDFGVALPR